MFPEQLLFLIWYVMVVNSLSFLSFWSQTFELFIQVIKSVCRIPLVVYKTGHIWRVPSGNQAITVNWQKTKFVWSEIGPYHGRNFGVLRKVDSYSQVQKHPSWNMILNINIKQCVLENKNFHNCLSGNSFCHWHHQNIRFLLMSQQAYRAEL